LLDALRYQSRFAIGEISIARSSEESDENREALEKQRRRAEEERKERESTGHYTGNPVATQITVTFVRFVTRAIDPILHAPAKRWPISATTGAASSATGNIAFNSSEFD